MTKKERKDMIHMTEYLENVINEPEILDEFIMDTMKKLYKKKEEE